MFLAYPEGPSYRLVSIRYRNVSGTSSSSYGDWPVRELVDLQSQHIYSHTLLPYQAPSRRLRAGRFKCLIAAEVSTWSRHPTTRITLTLVEMRNHPNLGARVSIFDIKFIHDVDGRDTFILVHEYKTQKRMAFLTTPSAALRAITHDAATRRTSTLAVTFNEYDKGAHSERMNRFQLPRDSEGSATYSTLRMDPHGRMLVYQIPLAKCIAVIRFDE